MNKIKVSAPGKLMLFGEHAVVYGYPSIVTAVDQRLFLTAEKSDRFILSAPDVGISRYTKSIDEVGRGDIPKSALFIETALKNMKNKYSNISGVKINTSSQFSSKFGFGSSSASSVCLVFALSKLFNLNLSKEEVFKIAYKSVLDVQKKGSGFDVAAATFGGTIYFKMGKKSRPIPVKELPIVVGYTGVKADTVEIVNKVALLYRKKKRKVNNIFLKIEEIVKKNYRKIQKLDWVSIGVAMNINEKYLEELGVGSRKLTSLINAANDAGAYGAKLSGAGVGDCMIAVVAEEKRKAVIGAIGKAGGQVMNVKFNAEGVRVE